MRIRDLREVVVERDSRKENCIDCLPYAPSFRLLVAGGDSNLGKAKENAFPVC